MEKEKEEEENKKERREEWEEEGREREEQEEREEEKTNTNTKSGVQSKEINTKLSGVRSYGESDAKSEEITRIVVSKISGTILNDLVQKVNQGFIGGKVTKSACLDYLIQKYAKEATEQEVLEIRSNNYSEITLLENLLKNAKETGKVPEELRSLLQKQYIFNETQKKKPKG